MCKSYEVEHMKTLKDATDLASVMSKSNNSCFLYQTGERKSKHFKWQNSLPQLFTLCTVI